MSAEWYQVLIGDQHDAPLCRADNRPTVSIVIPALNEAESLHHVLSRIPEDWVDEVLLVDGHSKDATVAVTRRARNATRIVMQQGRGKGAAIRSGFAAARGDIVVTVDADGSTDPAEIPAFVGALVSGADFAKGSRFMQGGGTDDMPFHRRLANKGLTMLANLIAGTQYTDITYGYNATWRRHAGAMALDVDGWANEILTNIRVATNGLRVVEVASFERERVAGQAKLAALPAGWTILKAMLKEPLVERRRRRQMHGALSERDILRLGHDDFTELLFWEEAWPPDREQERAPSMAKGTAPVDRVA